MAGPCSSRRLLAGRRHVVARRRGPGRRGPARGCRATPARRSTALPGAQMPPPERAVEPPNVPVFSSTTTRRPWCAAVSAAVIPAAPLPTTTTSNSASGSRAARPLSWPPPAAHTRTRCSFGREPPWLAGPDPDNSKKRRRRAVGRGRRRGAGGAAGHERLGRRGRRGGGRASGRRAPARRWRRAAAGADVLVIDRFGGGGATALSGGVVYAGGGTPQQRAAGVDRHAEAMFGYLSTEVGDVVSAGDAARVLRRQPGHAGLAGGPRRAVRGQPVPGQDLLPHQPALPVLLRQRAVGPRRRAARAARAPGPRPRHLGRRCCTRGWPRPCGAPAVRVLAQTTRRSAGHRRRRPGRRAWSADPARRAAGLGPYRAPGAAPLVGASPTCTRPGWAASCTARWPGWSAGTAGRCGSAPAAAW